MQASFTINLKLLIKLLKILDVVNGRKGSGMSDVMYELRDKQVLLTLNFRILTQSLKILEFRLADLNFKFSTFFVN